MRAIIIDPADRTVVERDVDEDLDSLQRAISYPEAQRAMLELGGYLRNGDVLYVDEEGAMKVGLSAFLLNGRTFVGRGIILALGSGGETLPATSHVDDVKRAVTWSELKSTGSFGEAPPPSRRADGTVVIHGAPPLFGA